MVETKTGYQIPKWQQLLQSPACFLVDRFFPTVELDDESKENLKKAGQLLTEESGMLIPIDHFAKPEFFYLFRKIFQDPEFSKRGGLMALGAHEYYPYITGFAKSVGVDTMPIVINSSGKVMGLKSRSFGAGLGEYLEASGERLAHGGTVLAIPQGRRKSTLGEASSTLINDLLSEAEYQGAQKLAVLPVGISLAGDADYENRGFHFFEHGVVKVMPPRTRAEIIAITGGKPRDIEAWVFEQLREAVLENYR